MERLDVFMARANALYYASHDPFADFTTSPEISQVFGELLGAWAAVVWQGMGCPDPVILAEAGPGRGTLMADALRIIARTAPGFAAAAHLHLVETSPRLRAIQAGKLPGAIFHDCVEDLPQGPLLLLGNEFLDALPIRQFVRSGRGWAERHVEVGRFVEVPGATPEQIASIWRHACPADMAGLDPASRRRTPEPCRSAPETGSLRAADDGRGEPGHDGPSADAGGCGCPEGSIVELCEPARALVAHLAARLMAPGGAALFIDYGPETSAAGDSLQALRDGGPADPLADPGSADLTAHVDFAALARMARARGAAVYGPVAQGRFLTRLGLYPRTHRLAARGDARRAAALMDAAARLAQPERMGRLFKVLAICDPRLPMPPGFADP